MGLSEWLFGRQRKRDAELLTAMLSLQSERVKHDAEIEKLDREIKLKTRQLELDNLERISEEKRKDVEMRARLREQRRQWAQNARDKLAAKKTSSGAVKVAGGVSGCVVCVEPSSPHLTADEIRWHQAGHPGAMQQ